MPVSIVVGGQFGSEGKGKVALEIARRAKEPVTVVRVGGPNSGHTAYDRSGKKWALRQMPASCIDRNVDVVFPAGSYIDVDLLLAEIETLQYPTERISINPRARIITQEHKIWEREAGLVDAIGSTGSGVGGAVVASVARGATNLQLPTHLAEDIAPLRHFIAETTSRFRKIMTYSRIIIEGTQGFGLSLLESESWPKVTSRSTTASAALAETGLSPFDVDDVTMVIRSYPIRVAGKSGPLRGETTWAAIAELSGRQDDIREYTTVTNKLRRVGQFDAAIVRAAIEANAPTRLVLNHLDYIGSRSQLGRGAVKEFIEMVSGSLGMDVKWVGFDPFSIVDLSAVRA